ncbi:MAG: hypothetical protein ACT6WE_33170, partial [Shinella sp.]|uniref:hypothetical protein n=1 Tax=Shinella sp. TaxID=1870904 RepID=UPI0040370D9D
SALRRSMPCGKRIAPSRRRQSAAASGCAEWRRMMAALTILFTVFISTVFTFDFMRTIIDLKRDRAALKVVKLKTEAGGFGV